MKDVTHWRKIRKTLRLDLELTRGHGIYSSASEYISVS